MHGLGTIFCHEMKKIGKEKSLLLGFILLPVISLLMTVGVSLLQPKGGEEAETQVYRMFFAGVGIERINIGSVDGKDVWIEPVEEDVETFLKSDAFHEYDVLVDYSDIQNVHIYYYENNGISAYLKLSAESFVRESYSSVFAGRLPEGSQIRTTALTDLKEKENANRIIAMLLPYMLILPLTANIANFASDTVAGDKARGTFYQVMLSPVAPISLILGKIFSVCAISLLSSTLYIGLDVLGSVLCEKFGVRDVFGFSGVSVSSRQILLIVLYAVLLCYLFSNLGVLISLFCKDMNQAQIAQLPVTLLCTVSALLAMFRFGISPKSHYLIPIYNLCLIFQDLLNGRARLENMIMVAACLFVLAVAVMVVTLLSYRSERVRT